MLSDGNAQTICRIPRSLFFELAARLLFGDLFLRSVQTEPLWAILSASVHHCQSFHKNEAAMLKDGFLGYQTSFMLDFVVCALIIVVPLLLFSLWNVKAKHRYQLHRKLQLLLGVILLVAVSAFEIDLQVVHGGWENIVRKSAPGDAELAARIKTAQPWLYVHLVFAVTTPIIWVITLVMALKKFERPAQPGSHSQVHRILGWISTIDITLTAVTGLAFYYVAFMNV